MRKKANNLIFPLLILGIFTILVMSCNTDDNTGLPIVTTNTVTDITYSTAKCGGNITSEGETAITTRGVCWSTEQHPTILDNNTKDEIGAGNFVSSINGLSANTTYYVRAYATNRNGTAYGNTMSFTTLQGINWGSFIDSRDGTVYKTIIIGNQFWMAENLRYLPAFTEPGNGPYSIRYYYVYGYNGTNVTEAKATSNYTTYGVLYNWYAAIKGEESSENNPSGVQGVCPQGWHLPSLAEFVELREYLGGEDVTGAKLKEPGTTHWESPNTGATNVSGFTALPGGCKSIHDGFRGIRFACSFWTTTSINGPIAFFMNSDETALWFGAEYSEYGNSVRCIKD